jgi:hypothetical protein
MIESTEQQISVHSVPVLFFVFIRFKCTNLDTKQGILKGEVYHCTVDLLFDCFGLVCFANKNKNCQ